MLQNIHETTNPMDCFASQPQEFLICTTIYRAKDLPAFNTDTFVKIILGKHTKKTKTFNNSENPHFNELFCTISQLLRYTVLYEVMKKATCKKQLRLGELHIDLTTVWDNPRRGFYKKWGKLNTSNPDITSYLLIDLSIVTKNDNILESIEPVFDLRLEHNLLLPQKSISVKYSLAVYRGVFSRKSDYILNIAIAGCTAKLQNKKSSIYPVWNKEIQLTWVYPTLSPSIHFHLMVSEYLQTKLISEFDIQMNNISYGEEMPTIGPTWIYFYDHQDSNNYLGKVLIHLKTIPSKRKESLSKNISKVPAMQLEEKVYWAEELFLIEGLFWQGDFIHTNSSSLKLIMKCESATSTALEIFPKPYGTEKNLRYFLQAQPFKAIHMKLLLPDVRLKFESYFFLKMVSENMKKHLNSYKIYQLKYALKYNRHIKCLKGLLTMFSKVLEEKKLKLTYKGIKRLTELDKHRKKYITDFMTTIVKSFDDLKENLDNADSNYKRDTLTKTFKEIVKRVNEIDQFINNRVQDMWPEIFLFLKQGSKPVGICRLNAIDFAHSQTPECSGIFSRVRRTLVFKSINCTHTCQKCGCLYGNITGWIWIGLDSERYDVSNQVDWMSTENFYYTPRDYTIYNCKIFIYQAKIRPGSDKGGLCDPVIRISFTNCLAETSVIRNTLSPVWNEVVKLKGLCVPGTSNWYLHDPPILAVEIFDEDKKSQRDYLGCTLMKMLVGSQRKKIANTGEVDKEADTNPRPVVHKTFRDELAEKMSAKNLKALNKIFPPSLQWISLVANGALNAELLVSAEILEVAVRKSDDPAIVTVNPGLPKELVPTSKRHKVEVMFAGLRNCQKISFQQVSGRYKIKIQIGDLTMFSGFSELKIKNSILFSNIYVAGIVTLSEQLEYWPPIFVNHIDCSKKSNEISIGAALIADPSQFLDETPADCGKEEDTILNVGFEDTSRDEKAIFSRMTKAETSVFMKRYLKLKYMVLNYIKDSKPVEPDSNIEEDPTNREYTWWTKFYNSVEGPAERRNIRKAFLIIYSSELENQAEFNNLQDWAATVPLVRGIKNRKNANAKEEVYGILRCQIKIKPCERRLSRLEGNDSLKSFKSTLNTKFQGLDSLQIPLQVVVRIYIVQGINLRSLDVASESDAFIKLQLGQMKISDRANYTPNQSNPIFGKRFQFNAIIPRDHNLHISVYDKGSVNDELIGSTIIDLEDRLRSKHLPCLGIPKMYHKSGYNMWRLPFQPTEILEDICRREGVAPAVFNEEENQIMVGGKIFEVNLESIEPEDRTEFLAVHALNRLEEVPGIEYKLVPEHVETRNLYRKEKPGLSQGKIQLWIEMYEPSTVPPPLDITHSLPKKYELRVIVFNTYGVVMDEMNIFGQKMSDIFVKGWLEDNDKSQITDTHNRSLNGEGMFNWRMVFPFEYSAEDDMLIIRKKQLIGSSSIKKVPPILYLQIWDDDTFSKDDFLGALELPLSYLPEPAPTKHKVPKVPTDKFINLFETKQVSGWFGCKGRKKRKSSAIVGKIELQLEILTIEEATALPAGRGRNPPSALPTPNRPVTSFNPFLHPLKGLKYIIIPWLKRCLCWCCVLIIIFILIIGFFAEEVHELMPIPI